ncbi:signal peptidase I [Croceimicrobium hydrocarbonivorans]|uniref:Signal peptidase I n=1 Tax=Croceimicrobium hydrocarbonivorans TaxID=2761580 RepID=A0A7H0VF19_9FLAO|nr:signal peptidase I [Croceimicrobium hydrocarbonivorans]QNR24317.1 signal peptidase I [Croceimicrobium hydrocarbonivorans]
MKEKVKKPWIAALYSILFPSLGHLYLHKYKQFAFIWIFILGLFYLVDSISKSFFAFVGVFFLVVLFRIPIAIHAYRTAKRETITIIAKWDHSLVYLGVYLSISLLIPYAVSGPADLLRRQINFASIPTPSMEPSLKVGDHLAYEYCQAVKVLDIVVFTHPTNGQLYLSRCIAGPGDSLLIHNNSSKVNGIARDTALVLRKYYLVPNIYRSEIPDSLKKQIVTTRNRPSNLVLNLTDNEVQAICTNIILDSLQPTISRDIFIGHMGLYPPFERKKWTTHNLGPLWIPKKGSQIQLDSSSLLLYGDLIRRENSHSDIQFHSDSLSLNGQYQSTYKFKENYYFMMSDNRDNSLDSRYWGFLPESNIKGKALYLYYSRDWTRIGKSLKQNP